MSEIHAQEPVLTNEVLEDVNDEDFVFVQQDKKLVMKPMLLLLLQEISGYISKRIRVPLQVLSLF